MSTRSVRASGAERLERVEVMGSPVHQQYQRIIALLRMELGEGELNLLACPVVDENGEPVSWKARSGRALTPVTELPADERKRLEAARDATLAKIDAMIERLKSRGAPGMVTAQVLTAATTLSEDGGTLYSDGLGPVLVDWGSRDLGAAVAGEAEHPVEGDPDEVDESAADDGRRADDAGRAPPGADRQHRRSAFWIPAQPGPDADASERPEPRAEERGGQRRLQIHEIVPLSDEDSHAEPAPKETGHAGRVEETEPDAERPRFLPLDRDGDASAHGSAESGEEATVEAVPGPDNVTDEVPDEPVPVMPPRRRRLFARARRFSEKRPPWPASPPLVAESDEAFLRRQRHEGRIISADPLPQKSAARPRRSEPEGNALVWLVPAFVVGGITFYLSQSPAALEQLLARLPEPVARQFQPEKTVPEPLSEFAATPVPAQVAGERGLADRLGGCFVPPAQSGTGSVTLSVVIDAGGMLVEPAAPGDGSHAALGSAAVAALTGCQPFEEVNGPARLTVVFGPGGPTFVQIEAIREVLPQ